MNSKILVACLVCLTLLAAAAPAAAASTLDRLTGSWTEQVALGEPEILFFSGELLSVSPPGKPEVNQFAASYADPGCRKEDPNGSYLHLDKYNVCVKVDFVGDTTMKLTVVGSNAPTIVYDRVMNANEDEPDETLGAVPSHCRPDEEVYFSCMMKKGRILSICGKDLYGESPFLEYRFGKPDKVEMSYPKDGKGSLQAFTYSRRTRPRTTHLNLSFAVGKVKYNVFDTYEGDETTAGVIVTLKNGREVTLQCGPEKFGRLMDAEEALPRDGM